jgi:hypothetical protein
MRLAWVIDINGEEPSLKKDSAGRSKFSLAFGLVIVIALIIGILRWIGSAGMQKEVAQPLPQSSAQIRPASPLQPAPVAAISAPPAASDNRADVGKIPDSRLAIARAIANSSDLLILLQQALPEARRGNAAAQYFAGEILQACGDDPPSSTLEDARDKTLSLLQSRSISPTTRSGTQHGASVCAALWQTPREDIGYGGDWLMKAARSGLPLAMLEQTLSIDPAIPQDQRAAFLQSAIDSRDAEVMQSLAANAFSGADSGATGTAAAALVACELGADCGPQSDQALALRGSNPIFSEESSASTENASVQDLIDQQFSTAERDHIRQLADDFVARANNHQLDAKLTADENERFQLSVDAPTTQ